MDSDASPSTKQATKSASTLEGAAAGTPKTKPKTILVNERKVCVRSTATGESPVAIKATRNINDEFPIDDILLDANINAAVLLYDEGGSDPEASLTSDALEGDREDKWSARVHEVAHSMAVSGQQNRIWLTSDNRLIAGLTRLLAAKSLGWKTIKAEIIAPQLEPADEVKREEYFRYLSSSENVNRKRLTGYELDLTLYRQHKAYLALFPETGKNKGRKKQSKGVTEPAFADLASHQWGKSARWVQLCIRRIAAASAAVNNA